MIWNNEYESLPGEVLKALQLKRLKDVVSRVKNTVPFYRDLFRKYNIDEDSIRNIDDIRKFPFTTKDDLRDNYPYQMFSVPRNQIVRIHASSGTTGKPTVVGYTKSDISIWAEIVARSLYAAGVKNGDIIQNAYGYGLFTGGLGVHYGIEMVGASVIPTSGGNSKRQVMIMNDFEVDVLTCTPSYALNLYEEASALGIDLAKLKMRVGIFGAEPWSEGIRKDIEEKWHIDALDIYGLSEIMGPGVAYECLESKDGMHINEDHFLVELINPDTGEPVSYGDKGELVFTTLTKQAMPLIRYRTRDITTIVDSPCICGRTFCKMQRVSGRTDDMIIIRGVNVFPSQIESILVSAKGVLPHYQLIVDRQKNLDTLEVLVEVEKELFSDEVKRLQLLSKDLENEIKSFIGVSCKVKLVEAKSLERFEGKSRRVLDRRVLT